MVHHLAAKMHGPQTGFLIAEIGPALPTEVLGRFLKLAEPYSLLDCLELVNASAS